MWKNGNTCSDAPCGGGLSGSGVTPATAIPTAPISSVFMMFVTWLRCVASAPFGAPVVPDV